MYKVIGDKVHCDTYNKLNQYHSSIIGSINILRRIICDGVNIPVVKSVSFISHKIDTSLYGEYGYV